MFGSRSKLDKGLDAFEKSEWKKSRKLLEEALQQLAGRPFKLFLRKHTTHKLKAIGAGAVVTALLQSSSIVNLMLLAFVGSGIIQMQNGLAMMLGSNIGTTFTSWIVATVGFEFNIESFCCRSIIFNNQYF